MPLIFPALVLVGKELDERGTPRRGALEFTPDSPSVLIFLFRWKDSEGLAEEPSTDNTFAFKGEGEPVAQGWALDFISVLSDVGIGKPRSHRSVEVGLRYVNVLESVEEEDADIWSTLVDVQVPGDLVDNGRLKDLNIFDDFVDLGFGRRKFFSKEESRWLRLIISSSCRSSRASTPSRR